MFASLLLLAAGQAAQPATFNSRAIELFERDWVLMQWGLRQFDADGDRVLSIREAQGAAAAFKSLADGDKDGRVTTYEYGRAREFILARY